ncbi:hypothetical protein Tco_0886937, partial [Tanacetum coccineum]
LLKDAEHANGPFLPCDVALFGIGSSTSYIATNFPQPPTNCRFYEVEQALKERERHPINQRVKHPLEPVLDPDLYKKIQVSVTLENKRSVPS